MQFRKFRHAASAAHNLLPVDSRVTAEEASLMEPLAVVLHTMLLGSFRAGETALVLGAGPIGLLTIAALKIAGAKRIWAVEPLAHRREMAKAMGAKTSRPCAWRSPPMGRR